MNSNSNSNSNKNVCVYYYKGKFYFLHTKKAPTTTAQVYYFSTDPQDAIPLPDQFEVVLNPRTGFPFVRKKCVDVK